MLIFEHDCCISVRGRRHNYESIKNVTQRKHVLETGTRRAAGAVIVMRACGNDRKKLSLFKTLVDAYALTV